MKIFEDGCDVAELSFLRSNSSSSVLDELKLLYPTIDSFAYPELISYHYAISQ